MKKMMFFVVVFCLVLLPIGCTPANSETDKEESASLMISAAASLTDALNELKPIFEDEHPTIELTFNFGGSGKLSQMIIQGAPSDVFLSASAKDMDKLQKEGLIIENTRSTFAENELVLITNKAHPSNVLSFNDINPTNIDHFAIGEPESVPVGRYTKQVLEYLKLWNPMQGILVLSSDVRQVLTHVEMGNADIGVVYASDALLSEKVSVVATADSEWHNPIMYPGTVISDTSYPEEAKAFLAFLVSEEGREIFKKYGFN